MSSESVEITLNKKELATISGKPRHITIDALKTKKAYDDAFAEKGMQVTSKRDYIRGGQQDNNHPCWPSNCGCKQFEE